jgi:nucleoid-associated protein YgaU
VVSFKLKQYKSFGTKIIKVSKPEKPADPPVAKVETKRPESENSPKPESKKGTEYTVKSGDCLWNIAKKFYGDGSKNKTIYEANKEVIEATAKKYGRSSSSNGWWIYPNTKLIIPAL